MNKRQRDRQIKIDRQVGKDRPKEMNLDRPRQINKEIPRRGRLIKIDRERSVKIEKGRTGQTNIDKYISSQMLVEKDRAR